MNLEEMFEEPKGPGRPKRWNRLGVTERCRVPVVLLSGIESLISTLDSIPEGYPVPPEEILSAICNELNNKDWE